MNFLSLFRPRQLCLLCHENTLNSYAICAKCNALLPAPQTYHTPLLNRFNKNIALFNYHFPFNRLITALKFNHNLACANLLGCLLANAIPRFYKNQPLPKIIIPIPLHRLRLKERGFNQALEIAHIISKKLYIPIDTHSIKRITHTLPQSSLSPAKRQKNIKNAFALNNTPPNSHIVLLDDVVTTGHTLNAVANNLLNIHPALQIDTWCCAISDHTHSSL